jgi:hypothetical protein
MLAFFLSAPAAKATADAPFPAKCSFVNIALEFSLDRDYVTRFCMHRPVMST